MSEIEEQMYKQFPLVMEYETDARDVYPQRVTFLLAVLAEKEEQIAALKKELSDKSWRLRDPYSAFLHDAAKKDNCRNCVHARPATLTLPSAIDRISCKYAAGWPHWSTKCKHWEKNKALRGKEE